MRQFRETIEKFKNKPIWKPYLNYDHNVYKGGYNDGAKMISERVVGEIENLDQENSWLLTLSKELIRLENGKPEELEKQKIRVEKCKQRISDLERRLDDYCKQAFEPIEEENDQNL